MRQYIQLARLVGMQLQAELAQADFAQTPVHDIQRGDLLGHEKHALALGHALGDEVRDGLALAGARRADQDEVLASDGRHHCGQLRRIGGQWAKGLLRRKLCVQPPRFRKGHARCVGFARRVDQVLDDGALAQLLRPFGEVLPHQELGKREHGQDHVLRHLPTFDVLDRMGNPAPDRGHVDAGVVARHLAVANPQVQLEVLPQHLQQGGVESRLVLVCRQREARTRALAVQGHGQKDQRRLDALVGLVAAGPNQEAQRQEQGIGSTFLHRVSGAAVQVDEAGLHVVCRQADEDFALAERFLGMLAANVFFVAGLVQRLAARVGSIHQVRMRQQLEGLPLGQLIFQRPRLRCFEHQRLLARLEVQQRIAQGQIQQLALPPSQAVLRV